MLQIKDIHKKYVTGDLVQTALDGVSLTLRDNEFVAILGPSGSGKTTLLNVIGGLDRYDSGDLVINGISTKKYSDRDWDSYRNHTIGFVFQSYNLIPHQTVLSNVELALTISGISRRERRERARKALENVGLGNQLHKRPNQMSGGQMQRVAIARALVNNPDILLADEPTGALDSETSVQIMDLLQEVAKDRLVVMVTHNPELAEEYANRIVRVKDGRIIDDSNPYEVEQGESEPPRHKNMGRSSMSYFTALALSFNNLKTKLARTLLTSFAGSIGIIGIALIMSLSTGFQKYIDQIQEDTLSNYPLTIQAETADMAAAMAAFGSAAAQAEQAEPGTVIEQQMISQMFAQIGANDLGAFKTHLEENMGQVEDSINDIKYSYGVKPLIFQEDTSENILQVNPGKLLSQVTGFGAMSSFMDTDVFQEMIGNIDMLESQYDVLQGRWPEAYNEMIVVLQDPHQITDYMAYTVGIKDPKELEKMIQQVMQGQEPENPEEPAQWTYDDLMALRFRLVPASQKYRYNEEYSVWEDMSGDQDYMRRLIAEGDELTIVGIVCPKEGVSTTTLTVGIAYTSALTEHVIEDASQSEIVEKQLSNPRIDVFTGKTFGETEEGENKESGLSFEDMISVDEELISSAFGTNMNESSFTAMLESYIKEVAGSLSVDNAPAQAAFSEGLEKLASDMLQSYIAANADGIAETELIRLSDVEGIVDNYLAGTQAGEVIAPMASTYQFPASSFVQVYRPLLVGMLSAYIAQDLAANYVPETATLIGELDFLPITEDGEKKATTAEEIPPEEGSDIPSAPTEETTPGESEDEPSQPTEDTQPEDSTEPESPEVSIDTSRFCATIKAEDVPGIVSEYLSNPVVKGTSSVMGSRMMEATVRQMVMEKLSGFSNRLMSFIGNSFYVDEEKLASAFQFEMDEEELRRLMDAMMNPAQEASAQSNLRSLGYADRAQPTMISVYLVDFEGKENFLSFLDGYNADMETAGKEDQVIRYTDVTGIMMSSVKTIIDSVSYALIAFVAVSLIVSSIMIGIITYISVMERTKEIGVLRAIGASKRNISQVFNAETFIIGLCSGLIGVGLTLILNIPINHIIHALTNSTDINAQLPVVNGLVLIGLSVILTLIGGFIPSKQAAKKDPVIALRSE